MLNVKFVTTDELSVQIPRPSKKRLKELGVRLIAHRPPKNEMVYSILNDSIIEDKTAKSAYWVVENVRGG